MQTIEIKSNSGKVIFVHKEKYNTIKKTLLEAIKEGVNLRYVNLANANLRGVNLIDANLIDANLRDANLTNANLTNANLRGVNLIDANLRGADLKYAKNFTGMELWFQQTRCLPEGDIIGYKKALDEEGKKVIVKLLIPKEAKRSQAFTRKCRAEYAKVIDIIGANEAFSIHNNSFKYTKGKTVKPTFKFNEDWKNECASGIHFFITKVEAENYNY